MSGGIGKFYYGAKRAGMEAPVGASLFYAGAIRTNSLIYNFMWPIRSKTLILWRRTMMGQS